MKTVYFKPFCAYLLDLWTPFGKSSSFQSRFVLLVFLSASLGLGRPKKCQYHIYIYIGSDLPISFIFVSPLTSTCGCHGCPLVIAPAKFSRLCRVREVGTLSIFPYRRSAPCVGDCTLRSVWWRHAGLQRSVWDYMGAMRCDCRLAPMYMAPPSCPVGSRRRTRVTKRTRKRRRKSRRPSYRTRQTMRRSAIFADTSRAGAAKIVMA